MPKNQLTALDVSKNTALEDMDCSSNLLAALDVGKNTSLKSLYCGDNLLTALDVSGCTAMERLNCGKNLLTSLDLSDCTALGTLSCYDNQLTMLDLSANATLTRVSMQQMIEGQKLAFVNGSYQFELSKLVPLANMVKVTVSGDGQMDKATGKVTFTKKVYNLTYQYATGRGAMDVTVSFVNADDLIVPPTIKTQPKDANMKSGSKAKFTVKVKEKNVTYQWYYRTSETGEWVLMEGETSATLTVVATAEKIGWQFRCLAKNADGQAYSNPATLRMK